MSMTTKKACSALYVFGLGIFVVFTFACGNSNSSNGSSSGSGDTISLQGAGSTFANPLYQKWISEYGKAHPNMRIDYQSIGSGGGIKQIKEQTIDFGATDSAMTDDDLKSAKGGEILHIPVALGAVVLTYNLEGVAQPLKFSPKLIADIFLGNIKKWDDPAIKADNPGVNLPATDIAVVHRSDGSGTTGVFTDYLAKVSPDWKSKVGQGTSVQWPTGIGGKGNEGVTGQIKQTPNTIGYVELAYAVQNKLPAGIVKNKSGSYVEPTFDSVTAAASGAVASTPEDLRVSITDVEGANIYPISSYTYILPYKEQKDAAKGRALVDYMWWGIHDGQKYCRDLQFAPLPDEIVKRAEAKINSITSGGKPLHTN